ncbi:hypothetical protein CSKR_113463, partial [Clonorchis sinensis]
MRKLISIPPSGIYYPFAFWRFKVNISRLFQPALIAELLSFRAGIHCKGLVYQFLQTNRSKGDKPFYSLYEPQ